MTNAFINRLLNEHEVTTKKYRYVVRDVQTAHYSGVRIKRCLMTSDTIPIWETVKQFSDDHIKLFEDGWRYSEKPWSNYGM